MTNTATTKLGTTSLATTNIVLADASVGALFTVSAADWAAIDQRVQAVVRLSGIAGQVSQYLPQFEALVRVCEVWRDHTSSAIKSAAGALVAYCDQALVDFGTLQSELAGGPLTPTLQGQVVATVTALSTRTSVLDQQFKVVADAVADFVQVNQGVDAAVDAFVARLGPQWRSILPQATRVDAVAGHVRGIWAALSADLGALVSEPIDVTQQFIATLEIKEALLAWAQLRTEAAAFSSVSVVRS
ncbi:MAG TPA: hypothetical protein VIT20_00955 [Propionibacteriaceae bacterium]